MAPRWFSKHKNDVEEEVMSILEEGQGNGEIREEGKKMIMPYLHLMISLPRNHDSENRCIYDRYSGPYR